MTNPAEAAELILSEGFQECFNGVDALNWKAVEAAEFLAHAYLAEHQADDGEAITEEWFLSLTDGTRLYINHAFWLMFFGHVYLESDEDSSRLEHVTTRGDLRRLATALGIELKGH